MITCKNCSASFNGNYCPNCAQRADTHRFTLGHIVEEFFHAFTHADRGIIFLAKELFYRPGYVAKDYVAGMRRRYFNPITYFLIIVALHALAVQKSGVMDAYFRALENKSVGLVQYLDKKEVSTDDRKILADEVTHASAKSKKVNENSRTMMMLMIPLVSLFTWLLFRKKRYNYSENLVLNVLIMAQLELLSIILLVVPFLLFPSIVFWLFNFQICYMIAFPILAYKQFFGQSWLVSILKGLLAQVIYIGIAGALAELLSKVL